MQIKTLFTFLLAFILINQCLAQKAVKTVDLSSRGILPNTGKDVGPALRKVINDLKINTKNSEQLRLTLKKGRYEFFSEGAATREYYISNHDQTNPKKVGITLEYINNIEIDGNGAELLFHGTMLPIAIAHSGNVKLRNISIDFDDPQICQATIIDNDSRQGIITYRLAPWVKYQVRDSVLYYRGDGWEHSARSGIAFDGNTRHIVYNTGDLSVGTTRVAELRPGVIRAKAWKDPRLKKGTVIAMRGGGRPAPGIFIDASHDLTFDHVKIHYAQGMGLLAQLSRNINLSHFGVCHRGKDDPRYFTNQADATHFSGCSGVINSKDGLYEGMMDDAINVHGTYLKIVDIKDALTLRARYMHEQSYGFDWGFAGDTVQFIKAQTMDLLSQKNIITAIKPIAKQGAIREFEISFKDSLSPDLDPKRENFGIENLSLSPAVNFTGNMIRNNRARGALFSTPRKVLVANNVFDHTSGSAILLCGDCNGWYETGSCRDVTIRNNKFINALTSMYQFTTAVISVYPEIPHLEGQQTYFHSGIRIENNDFQTFDMPILYAKSVDGLLFKNNKITTNSDYAAFHKNKERIKLERVTAYEIKGNTLNGKAFIPTLQAKKSP